MNKNICFPLNIYYLPFNIKNLPLELKCEIFTYIEDELIEFWKKYFSQKVLFQLNPKDYFNKYILSKIDKGFKLVTSYKNIPCVYCKNIGYTNPNYSCELCIKQSGCYNCYWNNGNLCLNCIHLDNLEYIYLSWDDIKYTIRVEKIYDTYYDLIHSTEWIYTH